MMTKLAVAGVAICFAANTTIAALYRPVNVTATRAPIAYGTEHANDTVSEIRLAEGTYRIETVMPPLDVKAKRPHKAKMLGWVCGEAAPMVGVPGGRPSKSYGRVARCERM